MTIDPIGIIRDIYPAGSIAVEMLLNHSRNVRDRALQIARQLPQLKADTAFIAEAAMLHDIGMIYTAAAAIGCHGSAPYIRHGLIGREMLETRGLPRHGLVCERHIGVGLSRADIVQQALPLPERDMLPLTLEEIIICYADTFFSKTGGGREHTAAEVAGQLSRFGRDKVDRFMRWHHFFNPTFPRTRQVIENPRRQNSA